MKTDLKQNYLNKKYAEHNDEVDVPYIHKRPKRKAKKSNHKHEYKNCVIVDSTNPKVFQLISRCNECGKVMKPVHDKRIDRKFPNISYQTWFINYPTEHEQEYENFKEWCKNRYNTYDVPDFDLWKVKYI